MDRVPSVIHDIELIVSTRETSKDIEGDVKFLIEDVMQTHEVTVTAQPIEDEEVVIIRSKGQGLIRVKQHLVRISNHQPNKQDEIINAMNDIMTEYHRTAYQVTVKSIIQYKN